MDQTVIEIQISDPEVDDARLDGWARQLTEDLFDLGAEDVRPQTGGEAPESSKGLEELVIGGLLVNVLPAVLPKLFEFLQEWVKGKRTSTIRIKGKDGTEIEFTPEKRLTPDEIVKIARAFNAPEESGA